MDDAHKITDFVGCFLIFRGFDHFPAKILNNSTFLRAIMEQAHVIQDVRVRETLQIVGAILGVIGVIIAVLSFVV